MSYQVNLYHSPALAGHSRLVTVSFSASSHHQPPITSVTASLCMDGKSHALWWWQENLNPHFALHFSSFSSLFKEGGAVLCLQWGSPWQGVATAAAHKDELCSCTGPDTKHGPTFCSGEIGARSALLSPASLSQGLRGFIYSILKANINNPMVKTEKLLVLCFCRATNSGKHKERLV